jgi:hypothetical protein
MLSNPPFGVTWGGKDGYENEARKLETTRYKAGMPRVTDGALLFLQTMLAKMALPEEGGSRIAIIFNGSPLSNGDCGSGESETVEFTLKPEDNAGKAFREALADVDEALSVEWTHRHYVQDDEYIPYGEDIESFLKREIAKQIIRWEETKKDGNAILGYEILPNKYFYRYQPPTPAKDLLAEFWRLEKGAEEMLKGLAGNS